MAVLGQKRTATDESRPGSALSIAESIALAVLDYAPYTLDLNP